jgi:ATP/maltotriose-dependent transcriptional regulator MalT
LVDHGFASRALLGAAFMRCTQGELERARSRLTRALELAHGSGEMEIVVQAQNLFGYIEHAVGNFNAARDRFTRSVEGFKDLAIPWGTGNALSGLAGVFLATGDAARAEDLLDEATSVLRSSGPWFLLLALYFRAILAVRRGKPDQAIALVRESLTQIRQLHDKFEFVYAMVPLAAAAALKGDDEGAARILGARDAVTDSTGAAVVDESVLDLREQAERDARARLGPDRWTRAYAVGRNTSIDALLKDIDNAL